MATKKKATAKKTTARSAKPKKAAFKEFQASTVKELVKHKAAGRLGRAKIKIFDGEYKVEVPTGAKNAYKKPVMHTVFEMEESEFALQAALALGLKIDN